VTSTAGAIVMSFTEPVNGIVLTRSGTVSLTGKLYIAVTWKTTDPVVARLRVNGWGEAVHTDAGSGWATSFFAVPAGVASVTALAVKAEREDPSGGVDPAGAYTLSIDKVSTWTGFPFIGTARQKAMALIPGGSVRTQGSIQISHASNALGKVIVYTHPAGTGYLPPLRRWRSSSATVTTDSTLVSGARNLIGTTATSYLIPSANLPDGRVELWAFLRATTSTGTRDVVWSVDSWMGSTRLSSEVRVTTVDFPVLDTWNLVPLGATTMPPVKLGVAGAVAVDIVENPVIRGIEVDEAYLFATDRGNLTVVECFTGTPAVGGASNRLWIDAPSLDQPMGGVWRGTAADRSDAFHAGSNAQPWDRHDFAPQGTSVFVATFGATDAQTSLTHYKRFNTFVARGD
jgi:hypothetical protein